jgi:hypothetical protein
MDRLSGSGSAPEGDLWLDDSWGSPFWQQVYHVVYYLDYWLREDYSSWRFLSLTFDKNLSADLGRRSPDHLTKTEFVEYLAKAEEKVVAYLAVQNMLSLATTTASSTGCWPCGRRSSASGWTESTQRGR